MGRASRPPHPTFQQGGETPPTMGGVSLGRVQTGVGSAGDTQGQDQYLYILNI